jgi:hypothetical protein
MERQEDCEEAGRPSEELLPSELKSGEYMGMVASTNVYSREMIYEVGREEFSDIFN